MKIPLILNGEQKILEVDPAEKLLTVLRREKLFSAKSGCEKGICGACTVLLDDRPVPSCIIPAAAARDSVIETLEHFSQSDAYADIIGGFSKAGVRLCGYCNAGKIFVAYDLIRTGTRPSRGRIYEAVRHFNCPCTETDTLVQGILFAASVQQEHGRRKSDGKN